MGKKTGPRSIETRKKMSAASMGNKKWLGKKHTDETKKKMSAWQKGIKRGPLPEETRKKMSIAQRERYAKKEELL